MADETYCPYCGASMKANATFCPSCGAQIAQSAGAAPADAQSSYAQPAGGYKAENSSLKTIGIITVILAVIAILVGIVVLISSGMVDSLYDQLVKDYPDYFKDLTVDALKTSMIISGSIALALGIVGIIGAVCCLKAEHYTLGLVMYVLALIINGVDIISSPLMALPGIIVAIILLVFYIKGKQSFSS